jgi:hypothetical protein
MYTPGMIIPDEEARRVGLLAGGPAPERPAKGLTIKPPRVADDAPKKSVLLVRMKLAELRALCVAEGINAEGANTRADYMAVIEAARASADET